ncbi:hypothetical protein AHMF7605_12985 [Adhaeribacter arboris]|uniref:Outer membrane protein beta-barrel domain-containing protein n=1 Tax=Adhaeribacter arboris TaxID=2072846 RepID=A0A2T2YFS6_9BACT|nr:hypothetical protein [Adhaeribacter arboris]PSR54360.1 hypothetical protein AHMF7605_12985 [Adhaeribacter arboris]
MKMDLMFTGKKGISGGLIMSFYGNKLKQEYHLFTSRDQNSAPPTMLLGVGVNKFIFQQEHREFNLQLAVCYAIQNITPKLNESDQEWTQLEGFSPGLVANYLVKIGKDKVGYYYGSPLLRNNYLNFHGAIRPVFFHLKQASGLMLELEISYRMGLHAVSEYKLKP